MPTAGNYEQYYKDVTNLFYKGIEHAWYEEDETLGPSFFYNWSLWFFSKLIQHVPGDSHNMNVFKRLFKYFEYASYKDAVERGVGLCSQHAIALADYLNLSWLYFPRLAASNTDCSSEIPRPLAAGLLIIKGVHTKVISLNGHVINEVTSLDEQVSILDADYNVTMNFSVQYAKDHPEVVEKYYISAGASQKESVRVAQIYKDSIYRIYPDSIKNSVVAVCFCINWFIALLFVYFGWRMHRKSKLKILC